MAVAVSLPEDHFTNYPEDAAEYERLRGGHDREPPWDEPTRAELAADEQSWKADRWRRRERYGPDEP